ncbi:patatin-like phospholipase family protein [uncultured Piscinibacter sp.]|uniref:patatin-like phospholipase family protein n=1 Tax=uncultured Piscinibacter sp. TaxID=1131835 RepID=UPI0026346D31|nr:patatin-like phospholipase family protein [uncultured Piscinibacter sp.]
MKRARIGLVLSGGGARGLAHVGVLKLLERERVPIDLIAGTSMGAIVGGLYASGMDAAQIESELVKVDWDTVFASRVDRQLLSQRRKEEDFEISPVLEFGMRDGELRAPLGALSGRGLETLLRRYTLPVREVRNFDALPIPFRALATDMETGQPVVLSQGDLALALRSSMSVPGVFAPTEVDRRILGDGGLVDNVPVGVARAMGADILIVVNIGTPIAGRETLGSVAGLTAQMINILTEQNVQRSLASLSASDVLIAPDLGKFGSADFARTRELIDLGHRGAESLAPRLAALALDEAAYAQWRQSHARPGLAEARLSFIRFEGTDLTNPQRFAAQLESKTGQPFDANKAERDSRRLAASGDYMRADYLLVTTPDGEGLVFDLEDKPWGPHYFRIGLDLETDFRGGSGFNVKISHNRHWLDANGSEWRNQVQIGKEPRWYTELYHPLNWTLGLSNDWFVSAHAEASRRDITRYDNDSGAVLSLFNRKRAIFGLDLGQPWAALGELRLGLVQLIERTTPDVLVSAESGGEGPSTVRESGLRLGVVIDQLDFANFPQHGYRLDADLVGGRRSRSNGGLRADFTRFEADGTLVRSWGQHSLNLYARLQRTLRDDLGALGRYTLGGFHQLSGYRSEQLDGNSVVFTRLTWYRRSHTVPVFTRGFFVGATLEAGNAWLRWSDVRASALRSGMSLFLGADTGLGPLYFGLTYAPRGSTGLYLFVGRP